MNMPLPAVFCGHGNPMNALSDNTWTRGWASIGASMPPPRAILVISAHWYLPHCAVTASRLPGTFHDFGGFPEALYEVEYPAPGSPELARRVRDLLAPTPVRLDEDRGLDHGVWGVLIHMFPNADIPVVQLGIDKTRPPAFHYETGKRLLPLREEGVLIMGSGNIVHNLAAYDWGDPSRPALDWARRFEEQVRRSISRGDDAALIDYPGLGPDAILSVPTPEHYLPLLYVLGLRRVGEPVGFPVAGVDGGAVSMLAVQFG